MAKMIVMITLVVAKCFLFATLVDATTNNYYPQASIEEVVGASYDGCYKDSYGTLNDRSVSIHESTDLNNNAKCIEKCRNAAFIIAATQGSNCYCSNSLPVTGNSTAVCDQTCPGVYASKNCRGDECCGGASAFSVFIVDNIDVAKELARRIAINFRNSRDEVNAVVLSDHDRKILSCSCSSGEIVAYIKAQTINSEGEKSLRTIKVKIGNDDNLLEIGDVKDQIELSELQLEVKSIDKQLQISETIREDPFGKWDLLCDNTHGSNELKCARSYTESASFLKSYSITSGVSMSVSFGITSKVGSDLVGSISSTFEASSSASFTSGFTETTKETITEGFSTTYTAKPGTKVAVSFFSSSIPTKVKWRADMFADGDVLLDYGLNIAKKVHLSQVLKHDQREVFAFGVIDYGERPTIRSITRILDKDGTEIKTK